MTQPQQQQVNAPRTTISEESTLVDSRFIAEIAAKRDDANATSVLNRSTVLPTIREKIESSRKPRLRIVEQFLCDCCDQVITDSSEGFLIHGNIYVADPKELGGLIGDNFPKSGGDASEVKKTVLCRRCFCKALGLWPKDDVSGELTEILKGNNKKNWSQQVRGGR